MSSFIWRTNDLLLLTGHTVTSKCWDREKNDTGIVKGTIRPLTVYLRKKQKKFAENSNDSNVLSSCEMIRCEVPHQWLGQQEIAASVTRFHEIGKFLLSAVGKSTATLDCLFKS